MSEGALFLLVALLTFFTVTIHVHISNVYTKLSAKIDALKDAAGPRSQTLEGPK